MLENLDFWHLLLLLLIGLFVFGERLPVAIGQGLRMLRQVRAMATEASSALSTQLGTDISIEDLNPRSFIRKHVFDETELQRPIEQLWSQLQESVAADPAPVAAPAPVAGPPEQPPVGDVMRTPTSDIT